MTDQTIAASDKAKAKEDYFDALLELSRALKQEAQDTTAGVKQFKKELDVLTGTDK